MKCQKTISSASLSTGRSCGRVTVLGWFACLALGSMMGAASGGRADAAEVRLLSSAAIKPAIDALAPAFERQTGHKLIARFELTPAIPKLIESGEPFAVAIANPPHIDGLIKIGKVDAGTRLDIAQFGVGIGVRAGAARPAAGSTDAFRTALLGATSVGFVGEGTSGVFFRGVLERLKIVDDMQAKLKPGGIQAILTALTKGEVQMVVMPVPLILAHAGAELAAPLPSELQDTIVMTAGASAEAGSREVGRQLVEFLMSAEATATLKSKGYDRVAQ